MARRFEIMKTTELTVKGMQCCSFANAVQLALAAVPGVRSVEVSLKRGSAQIGHDGADAQALLRAVADEGYEATVGGES